MPLMLAIYAEKGELDMALCQPVIDEFVQDGNRFPHYRKFEGCILVSVNELEAHHSFAEREDCLALAVGTASRGRENLGLVADEVLAAASPGELEGAFTALKYWPAQHRMEVWNGKWGMRPLFHARLQGHHFFCAEFDPLNQLPLQELDQDAVAQYFSLGTVLGNRTFRKGIQNIAPAQCILIDGASFEAKSYWEAKIAIDHDTSLSEHAENLVCILRKVVEELLQQNRNPIVLLSAGADSRLILSCIPSELRRELPYLTSNLSILAPEDDQDVIGAKALAEKLDLSKHQVTKVAFAELEFGPEHFDRNRHLRAKEVIGGWHGGEYLGGFCLKAAPIRQALNREAVAASLKKQSSWWFRQKLSQDPFEAYLEELGKMKAENASLQFMIQQMARSFFSTIYLGSRGHWLQPWQTISHGYSPFWDSRFLTYLAAVPQVMIADYSLYNEIFRVALTELSDIPSNSPLTQRSDSSLPKLTMGKEPKFVLQSKYQTALNAYKTDPKTWRRRQYPLWGYKHLLEDGNAPETLRFIDFEAWVRKFG